MSRDAKSLIDEADLLISPMFVLEPEYLLKLKRIERFSVDVRLKLQHELSVGICDVSFLLAAKATLNENRTRDPLDHVIVAHARANGSAALISAVEQIATRYPRTVW